MKDSMQKSLRPRQKKSMREFRDMRFLNMLKGFVGSCNIIMKGYALGNGSIHIIMHHLHQIFMLFLKSEIHFTLGKPFKRFDQLMSMLPAASAHALPLFYRKLMTDDASPILDFYPPDFELDMNGKHFAWQAICKLPFIEESRLLSVIAKVEHTLTAEERQRNSFGSDVLFVHASHPLAVMIIPFSRNNDHLKSPGVEMKEKIDPTMSGGMNGCICVSNILFWPGEILPLLDSMSVVANNKVLSVFYNYPPFHPHIPRLPGGVILPRKSVRKRDVLQPQCFWHETTVCGHVSSRRPIHKSVSGPSLAKLAHQLVSKYISSKQQDRLGCLESGSHVIADGLEEMRINSKRKWNHDDGDHAGVVGENHGEIVDGKHKKRKKKSEKSKQSITGSLLNNSVEKLDICSSVEKPEGEFLVVKEEQQTDREQSKGDGNHANVVGENNSKPLEKMGKIYPRKVRGILLMFFQITVLRNWTSAAVLRNQSMSFSLLRTSRKPTEK